MTMILDGSAGLTTPGVVNTAGETIATTLVVTGVTTLTGGLNAALPVLSGGTGVTTSTGTGANVLGTSPTITGATITVAATAAPAFSAYQSTGQTVTSSTFTKLSQQTEEFDTNSNFDSTTNYRFTPTVAGYYQINCSFALSTGDATIFLVSVYKNGSEFKRGVQFGTGGSQSVVSVLMYLNGTTDYVESYGYQGSGVSKTSSGSSLSTYFQAAMIRSA
jgi:hypothetical protein